MLSLQGEVGLGVLGNTKGRLLKTLRAVAQSTLIRRRRCPELAFVWVTVTGPAHQPSGSPKCLLTFRLMTQGALNGGMLSLQRERGCLVKITRKQSWFVTRFVVTRRAIGPACPLPKLILVCVFMTIPAPLVFHRTSKITVAMAPGARLARMPARQREFRPGMIEVAAWLVTPPPCSRMARLTTTTNAHCLEAPTVRVRVATLARRKDEALKYSFGRNTVLPLD